jgi:hypothetical protein
MNSKSILKFILETFACMAIGLVFADPVLQRIVKHTRTP